MPPFYSSPMSLHAAKTVVGAASEAAPTPPDAPAPAAAARTENATAVPIIANSADHADAPTPAAAAAATAGAQRDCETVLFLDPFLAASVRFCEGAPADRLFNSLRGKHGTGFKHVEVFELPEGATLPFPGRPGLFGDLALPAGTSKMLQRRVANHWHSFFGHKFYLDGGSGVGKTVLLNALVAKAYATTSGRDIFCHDEQAGVFVAILRSQEALERAGIEPKPGQTHVVLRLDFRATGGVPSPSRAAQAAAVKDAFPTFDLEGSFYFYHPAADAKDGSSAPFLTHATTVAAGSLNALKPEFKRDANVSFVPDAAPEVFLEQAAVVMQDAKRDFNVKVLAVLYIMWGASLTAALDPAANSPSELLPRAQAAGMPAPADDDVRAVATLRNRLVGFAEYDRPVLRTAVFRGVRDEEHIITRFGFKGLAPALSTTDGSHAETQLAGIGAVVTGLVGFVVSMTASRPPTLDERVAALDALWDAAYDKTVSCNAFVAQWRALLPEEHVPPPAFLTQPPAWVDADAGGIATVPRAAPAKERRASKGGFMQVVGRYAKTLHWVAAVTIAGGLFVAKRWKPVPSPAGGDAETGAVADQADAAE